VIKNFSEKHAASFCNVMCNWCTALHCVRNQS